MDEKVKPIVLNGEQFYQFLADQTAKGNTNIVDQIFGPKTSADFKDYAERGMFFFDGISNETAKLVVPEKSYTGPSFAGHIELTVKHGEDAGSYPLRRVMDPLFVEIMMDELVENVDKDSENGKRIVVHIPNMTEELKKMAKEKGWNTK